MTPEFQLPISLLYLLKSLDLCFWQDVSYLLDKDGCMQVPEIREFLALVKGTQQVFPTYDEILARHQLGIGTKNYWYRQYSKARHDLVEFLEENIKNKTAIKFEDVTR